MEHIGNQQYNKGDGCPSGGINIVANEPINGNEGWNLMGGYQAADDLILRAMATG